MSRLVIVKWCRMFEDSRTDLTDEEMEGRPATKSTRDIEQRVEDIIRSDFKVREAHFPCSENSKSI